MGTYKELFDKYRDEITNAPEKQKMTSLKRIFIDKDSASAINRLFSTAMGVFILSSLISAIGPTIDGIVVGSY